MARIAHSQHESESLEGAVAGPVTAAATGTVARPVALSPTRAVSVLTGTHFHGLDEKSRVIIPTKLRPALADQFWMMLDENDNIGVYNFETGQDIMAHCERMMAEYPGDEDIAAAVERITGAAELVTVENGWRVQVPEILRFYTGIYKEVVTVGVLNRAAIWDRAKWEEVQEERMHSSTVRKVQAEMLRRAASGFRKANVPAIEEVVAPNEASGVARAGGSAGRVVLGADRTRAASASAGDGKRGPRALTLSQLGR